jgi:methylmalonyl-CoA/ethylmalonyl-CoA epimerase
LTLNRWGPAFTIEVRAAGFGMPKLKDGETALFGHLGYEVDDLEDTKAELTRRGV